MDPRLAAAGLSPDVDKVLTIIGTQNEGMARREAAVAATARLAASDREAAINVAEAHARREAALREALAPLVAFLAEPYDPHAAAVAIAEERAAAEAKRAAEFAAIAEHEAVEAAAAPPRGPTRRH